MGEHHNVVILGSGPAGYTAAIYLGRAGLSPLLFSGYAVGGQLMTTTDVENYPGFPTGVQGPELMDLFRRQAERFGTTIVEKDVTKVTFSNRPFEVWVDHERVLTKSVVVATGANAKRLGMKGENAFMGRGVSTCATCDGAFFRGKTVAVVGGGDTAAEEALYLSRLASQVFVVHRRDSFRASHILVQRMTETENVSFLLNRVVVEVKGNQQLETMVLKSTTEDGVQENVAIDGLFEAIGHEPNTALFEGQLERHANGYLKVKPGTAQTNVDGVFAAGDVQDSVYRQAVTAAGSGCMAAIECERFLNEE